MIDAQGRSDGATTDAMRTHNETVARAPVGLCFRVAADVERWPEILPHYREVRFLRREGFGIGRVRMSAWRHFGPLLWPTWWESEMAADPERGEVHYRHVAGVTRRMRVVWRLTAASDGTRIVILHDWEGPRWPVIGAFAARHVIGPHFVRVIADRTLAGVRREAERLAAAAPGAGAIAGDGSAGDESVAENAAGVGAPDG